jgi:hypothetical protein
MKLGPGSSELIVDVNPKLTHPLANAVVSLLLNEVSPATGYIAVLAVVTCFGTVLWMLWVSVL